MRHYDWKFIEELGWFEWAGALWAKIISEKNVIYQPLLVSKYWQQILSFSHSSCICLIPVAGP